MKIALQLQILEEHVDPMYFRTLPKEAFAAAQRR
jgi:hypothetical protein